jgi:hypothetical protein
MTDFLNNDATRRPRDGRWLMQEYYRQAEMIIERARQNKRALSDEDMKKLKELERMTSNLKGTAGPYQTVDPVARIFAAERAAMLAFEAQEAVEAQKNLTKGDSTVGKT